MKLAEKALALLCVPIFACSTGRLSAQELPVQVSPVLQSGTSNTDMEPLISSMVRRPDYRELVVPPNYGGIRKHRSSNTALNRARQLSAEACQYIRMLQYGEAEKLLEEAISVAPDLANAHSNLGYLYNKTGRPQQAIPHLEYASANAPEQPAPLVTLAGAYQLCGLFEKAIATYRSYLARFPYNPDRAFIGDILSRLENEYSRTLSIKSRNDYRDDDYLLFSNHNGLLSWAKNTLKVYIAPGTGVRGYRPQMAYLLQESFRVWESAGPVKFEFVSSPLGCDIDCSWVDNPGYLASPGEGGEATMSYEKNHLRHCKIVLLTKRLNSDAIINDNEMSALCLHEIGHSLGLIDHSPNPSDVMFCTILSTKSKPALSQKDLLTLQRLYANTR